MLRPVEKGMCRYESIIDGTLSLGDVLLMNNYLNCQDENQQRFQEANE